MKSIVQQDLDVCFPCGHPARFDDPLDTHHCFGGALRKKSEKDGLTVRLHHNSCHQFGENAVHQNMGNMLHACLDELFRKNNRRISAGIL